MEELEELYKQMRISVSMGNMTHAVRWVEENCDAEQAEVLLDAFMQNARDCGF